MTERQKMLDICWPAYKALGEGAFPLSHYDLARITDISDIELWKAFLMDSEVAEWIKEENALVQNAELNKLLANVSKSRSVGQAQLINALSKIKDETNNKEEGPAFIYMYVPLDPEQEHAENVVMLDKDPFIQT